MTRRIPTVRNNMLHEHIEEGSSLDAITVGSAAWYSWLELHRSFRLEHNTCTFTARKEQRSGGWYWYAYRRQGGRLRTAYLGRSAELTKTRLHAIAAALADSDRSAVPHASFSPVPTTLALPEPAPLHTLPRQLTSLGGSEQDVTAAAKPFQRPDIAPGRRVDWGEAPDVPTFYGRGPELATLEQWVVKERCRVVSVLGMGGIGKSALSVTLMHRVAEHFEVVLFRSLRDAPSCEALLDDCLQVVAPQSLFEVPTSLERRISLLLEQFRRLRVLVVLDNLEALLEEGEVTGRFRPGFEGYGRLLCRVGETAHQSCLLATSREKPLDLLPLEGHRSPVRVFPLAGLDVIACEQLLAEKNMVGTPHEWVRLVAAYAGNPLALKLVAQTIIGLFEGSIDQFLSGGDLIFGDIQRLLAEHFARLSTLDRRLLTWLAIAREPVSIDQLLAMLATPLSRVQVLEAVEDLQRRSLIERGQQRTSYMLQSVVLEYVTTVLVLEATSEIEQRRLNWLIEHTLEQAKTKEYVRQAQERLIVVPVLTRLRSMYQGRAQLEEQLLSLLAQLRERADYAQGYGPANLLALLREHWGHLRGLDLSRLVIRGAYLQGVEMQDTSLAGAILRDIVWTSAFDVTFAVAISSTGRYWAAGSRRGEVRVWREEDQRPHLAWQAHTDTVQTLTFSPDEQRLATGGYDGTFKLWDLESAALLWTGWHHAGIQSLAFSPDGRSLASAGDDATVGLWDAQTGMKLQTLQHPGTVYAVAWGPDGRLLASGCYDGLVRLWKIGETQTGTRVKILAGHINWVRGLAFNPAGTRLASGGSDKTVKLWEVESQCCLQTLSGHTDWVRTVAWSPDGRTVASGGFDNTIWLWDVERGSYRMALHGHTAVVYDITFTPDSGSVLSASEDGTMRVWDVERGQRVQILQGYAASFYDITWSPDGTLVASAGTDTLVTIWNVAGAGSGGTPPWVLGGHRWIVQGVAWSPDGRLLASSGWDNVIRLWDLATLTCIQALSDPDYPDTIFYGVAWSPDGRLLASGSYQRGVQVWDVTTHTRLWVGCPRPTLIRRLAWSRDGTRLASGGDDGSVCLWKASDGTLLQTLRGHSGMVTCVMWSPDDTQLASGGGSSESGELFLWDTHSWERLRTFTDAPGSVFVLDWSPNGVQLVSGGRDGMLRWWEVQSGKCLRVRAGHQGVVQSLRVSPDGRRFASCGDDNTLKLWDLASGELLQTLRRDRPYERLNITGVQGLTEAQEVMLRALGAVDEERTMSLERVRADREPLLLPRPAHIPSPAPSLPTPAGLTPRERDVLRLLALGLTSAQMAEQLIISLVTVNSHVRSIYNKLGVTSRSAATRYAFEHKLV